MDCRLRYWIPLSAFISLVWIGHGFTGLLYSSSTLFFDDHLVHPLYAHMWYSMCFDLGTLAIVSQFFVVEYTSIKLHFFVSLNTVVLVLLYSLSLDRSLLIWSNLLTIMFGGTAATLLCLCWLNSH